MKNLLLITAVLVGVQSSAEEFVLHFGRDEFRVSDEERERITNSLAAMVPPGRDVTRWFANTVLIEENGDLYAVTAAHCIEGLLEVAENQRYVKVVSLTQDKSYIVPTESIRGYNSYLSDGAVVDVVVLPLNVKADRKYIKLNSRPLREGDLLFLVGYHPDLLYPMVVPLEFIKYDVIDTYTRDKNGAHKNEGKSIGGRTYLKRWKEFSQSGQIFIFNGLSGSMIIRDGELVGVAMSSAYPRMSFSPSYWVYDYIYGIDKQVGVRDFMVKFSN